MTEKSRNRSVTDILVRTRLRLLMMMAMYWTWNPVVFGLADCLTGLRMGTDEP